MIAWARETQSSERKKFCLFYFFIPSTGMVLSALHSQTNTVTFLVLTFGLYIYIYKNLKLFVVTQSFTPLRGRSSKNCYVSNCYVYIHTYIYIYIYRSMAIYISLWPLYISLYGLLVHIEPSTGWVMPLANLRTLTSL